MIQDQIDAELKKARRALETALNLSARLTRDPEHSVTEKRRYSKVRRQIGRMLDSVNSVRHVRPPYNIEDSDLNFRDPDLNPTLPMRRPEPPQIRVVEYEESE